MGQGGAGTGAMPMFDVFIARTQHQPLRCDTFILTLHHRICTAFSLPYPTY